MRKTIASIASVLLLWTSSGFVGSTGSQTLRAAEGTAPVTHAYSTMGISYPEGRTLGVKLKGTHRLPKSSGEAKVERKKGTTEIEIELDEMKPATLFGGDFTTYVLWVVSPEGHAHNVGEFILEGNRSKLNVSTTLSTFGLLITAEPHFLVESPSRFVVLENTRPTGGIGGKRIVTVTYTYRGSEGLYQYDRETLVRLPESQGEMRAEVREAYVAVELAERAGAEQFAPIELARARESLRETLAAAEDRVDRRDLTRIAHATVRLAVAAQKRAERAS